MNIKHTPKQQVLAKYPKASLWHPYKSIILSSRGNGIVDFIGFGETPALAWKDALNRIKETP